MEKSEKTLPSHYYYDQDHYENELTTIWYKNWIYVCRTDALTQPRAFSTIDIGTQNALVLRDDDGCLKAFHNVCPHRGSRLIAETEGVLKTKYITCAYHSWCFKQNGELKATTSKIT
ncbi:MAG: Rieske 2Fe-2S domain-containing protein, partial [Emcibacteraceae bacterium]|nr:Rieske 2Fe-2S domain-containing protein [Emcibacteraceae bacterium]